MAGFKTEGVVLKRRDFGEADRLLTVFTQHRGKVTILAKGVRRITSRRAGNVELLNRVQLYLHQGKNFLILTEASAIEVFQKIKENLTLSTYAYHVLELTDKITAENQQDPIVYDHLIQVLTRFNIKPRQILIRAFEAKVLAHLGFISFLENDSYIGGFSENVKQLLGILETARWDQIEELEINAKEATELERVLKYYIEKVLESSMKSLQVLKSLKA